jgi:small subunit ribosomal protein S16
MLKIRLARGGRKNVPFYRIVVANSTSPRDGKFIEKIGTYNPLVETENRFTIKKERAEYWLSVGAKPTDRIAIFLVAVGVEGAKKYKLDFKPKQKGDCAKKKALEKMNKAKEEVVAVSA